MPLRRINVRAPRVIWVTSLRRGNRIGGPVTKFELKLDLSASFLHRLLIFLLGIDLEIKSLIMSLSYLRKINHW